MKVCRRVTLNLKDDKSIKKRTRAPVLLPYVPGMKVKPLGSCMTPVEAPALLRMVPLALMLLLPETGAR